MTESQRSIENTLQSLNAGRANRRAAAKSQAKAITAVLHCWDGASKKPEAMERWYAAILRGLPRLSASSLRLAMVYRDLFDSSGRKGCWVDNEKLATKSCLATPSVKAAKLELAERGYLIRQQERRGGGKRMTITYPAFPFATVPDDDLPY